MKTIRVVAAVIKDGDRIFATARGYGDFKGGWEFPGGKIEPGETSNSLLDAQTNPLPLFLPHFHFYIHPHVGCGVV